MTRVSFRRILSRILYPSINNVIMEEQHGFFPGRSATTCNILFCNFVFDAFSQNSQVDVVYTDFKKAFDLVNHCVLVKILKKMGFGEPLLTWFRSYLSLRHQWPMGQTI